MIVVLGDVMADVVAVASGPLARGSDTPARISRGGGGAAANVAAWLAALGEPAALVGRVGDDEAGRAAAASLAGVDLRLELDRERPTGCCLVIVEPGGERSMLPDPGANDGPVRLPDDLLAAGGHLHVAGYTLLRPASRPGALDALARARAGGMTTSLDPSSAALLAPGCFGDLEVDLLRCNADEALALTREASPDGIVAAARALRALAAEVVVTLGAEGALWTDGEAVERVPAPRAEIVDTTGAGDAFTAGLLAARAAGAPPRDALSAAVITAARALDRPGARPRLAR